MVVSGPGPERFVLYILVVVGYGGVVGSLMGVRTVALFCFHAASYPARVPNAARNFARN